MLCNCGSVAVQRTVKKEGPNKGRVFFCCGKVLGDETKCNLFSWVEDAPKAAVASSIKPVPPQKNVSISLELIACDTFALVCKGGTVPNVLKAQISADTNQFPRRNLQAIRALVESIPNATCK